MSYERLPRLTEADNKILIAAAQRGDEEALEKLVLHSAGMVKSVVRKFDTLRDEHEDLIQVGMLGLMKAIQKFELDRGMAFSTYAIPTIYGEVRRHLRDHVKLFKVPRPISEACNKIHVQQLYDLSPEEIRDKLSIDIETAEYALTLSKQHTLSLDKAMMAGKNGADERSLLDTLADIAFCGYDIVEFQLAFQVLTAREQEVLRLRYYNDRFQSEVAKVLGVSQMQVSRIERKAIAKLKDQFVEM